MGFSSACGRSLLHSSPPPGRHPVPGFLVHRRTNGQEPASDKETTAHRAGRPREEVFLMATATAPRTAVRAALLALAAAVALTACGSDTAKGRITAADRPAGTSTP